MTWVTRCAFKFFHPNIICIMWTDALKCQRITTGVIMLIRAVAPGETFAESLIVEVVH